MKLIVTNKFKQHMEAHKGEFIIPYTELYKKFEKSEEFKTISGDFIVITKQFNEIVGYNNLVTIDEKDNVIYAKRLNRNIYSKFVKCREAKESSKVVFVVKRNKYDIDNFNLITMFPGHKSEKEPEDMNITDKSELIACLNFWKEKALIWQDDIIDNDTITEKCPYKNLYLAIS